MVKRFEEFVVKSWEDWDMIGHGFQFGNCKLNPEFWVGKEDELKKILEQCEIHNCLPWVCFCFEDTGFTIEVGIYDEDTEFEKTWLYEGLISRGNKIP